MKNMKKGGMLSVLAALLLLALSTLKSASALDVYFWSENGCHGTALACYGLASGACCFVPATPVPAWRPAVEVKNSASCKSTRVYMGGSCGSEYNRYTHNFCVYGKQFTGAKWFNVCRRRQLLADIEDEQDTCPDETANCKKTVEPNALSYKEPSGKAVWLLIKENVLGSYEQFMNLPDSEKVAWLTAQGATNITSERQEALTVVT